MRMQLILVPRKGGPGILSLLPPAVMMVPPPVALPCPPAVRVASPPAVSIASPVPAPRQRPPVPAPRQRLASARQWAPQSPLLASAPQSPLLASAPQSPLLESAPSVRACRAPPSVRACRAPSSVRASRAPPSVRASRAPPSVRASRAPPRVRASSAPPSARCSPCFPQGNFFGGVVGLRPKRRGLGPPKLPDPPWPPESPDPPWPPESPDPPWPPELPALPWPPELPDPPWPPESPDPPWPPKLPAPPWVPERAPPWRPPVLSYLRVPWGLQSAHPPSPYVIVTVRDAPIGRGGVMSGSLCHQPSHHSHLFTITWILIACNQALLKYTLHSDTHRPVYRSPTWTSLTHSVLTFMSSDPPDLLRFLLLSSCTIPIHLQRTILQSSQIRTKELSLVFLLTSSPYQLSHSTNQSINSLCIH